MKSLYTLITKTNLKSPVIAFPLVMPLIFLLLYSVGIAEGMDQTSINTLVASFFVTILAVMTMQSGLMGFGINFVAIKKSVLLRRIGATELEKKHVVIAVMLYGLTLYVITVVWIFLMMILMSAIGVFYSEGGATATAFGWIQYVSWLKLMGATLIMLYASYTLGMLFTSIAKDDQMYMGMAMMYFFLASFIGGLMFPGQSPDWMSYASYLVPHGYIDPLYQWVAGDSLSTADAVLGVVIPVLFGTACLFGSIRLLTFE